MRSPKLLARLLFELDAVRLKYNSIYNNLPKYVKNKILIAQGIIDFESLILLEL